VKSSSEDHEIIFRRCRARNCCGGSYFDPVEFAVTATSTGVVFGVAESPEQGDVGSVDEVSFDCRPSNMANSRLSRCIDCWSSYCNCLINRLNDLS
jgi:hypothetical protein